MKPAHVELLQKIQTFDIDGGDCELSFAARLSRENGWSHGYAERVIAEYKRYVFLSMISDGPRCPSEDVDAAWHLHLTYTRSYWQRFCGELLQRPLHHEPTRGGPAEAHKHFAMYDATLAAYTDTFGAPPPADIWPATDQRFGSDLRHRHVNTARNWIIPKRPVIRAVQLAACLLLTAFVLPGCQGGWNPFELKGIEFLAFLIPAMMIAIVVGRGLRSVFPKTSIRVEDGEKELTWEEAAYLAGGYSRLTSAAIARLADDQVIRVEGDRLKVGDGVPGNRTSSENAVIGHLPLNKSGLKTLISSVEHAFESNVSQLVDEGLALNRAQRFASNLAGLLPLFLVVVAFGVTRLVLGISNHKPVGFLAMTLIVGSILGMTICLWGKRFATRHGDRLLGNLRRQYSERSAEPGLAVALFGTTVLATLGLAYVNNWFPRSQSTGTYGGCGAGCSGGGCGGGGGGCGGGCGGCGGD